MSGGETSRSSRIEEIKLSMKDTTSAIDPYNVEYHTLSRIASGFSLRSSTRGHRGRSHFALFVWKTVVYVFKTAKDHVGSRSPRAGFKCPIRPDDRRNDHHVMNGKGKAQVGTHGARHALPQIEGTKLSLADGRAVAGDGWVLVPEGPSLAYPPS